MPSVHRSGNDRIRRPSRRRSPEAPARARQSPQGHGEAALLSPVIPAYSGPARTYQDRPVTPEVAGSSPVAPVKVPVKRVLLFALRGASDLGPQEIPRTSRTGIPADSRPEPVIPATCSAGQIAGGR